VIKIRRECVKILEGNRFYPYPFISLIIGGFLYKRSWPGDGGQLHKCWQFRSRNFKLGLVINVIAGSSETFAFIWQEDRGIFSIFLTYDGSYTSLSCHLRHVTLISTVKYTLLLYM
jgi:hypothetical protein